MADKHILHMLSPLKHVSPFDVNMALDAGFDAVVPYEQVQLDEGSLSHICHQLACSPHAPPTYACHRQACMC